VARYWLTECHVDGFRFDWASGVDYDSGNPMDPGFNPYHGIAAIAWAARQANPYCALIAEYWQLEGTHPDKTAAKLVRETEIDAVWNGDFHHTVDEVLNQRWEWEKKDIFRAVGGFRDLGFRSAAEVVNYTASHDEVRPEHEIQYYTYKNVRRPRGMGVRRLALARALLGLTALVAGAGVPMIYSGQEFGDNSPRTIDFVPLQWGLLRRAENKRYFDAVRRLIQARRSVAALRSDQIEFAVEHFAQRPVLRFWRWDEQGGAAVVALNFSHRRQRMELHFPYGGKWQNVVTGRTREVAGGAIELTFGPFAAALFVPV
jgi:1,4-alpha-glucan branching enzyme